MDVNGGIYQNDYHCHLSYNEGYRWRAIIYFKISLNISPTKYVIETHDLTYYYGKHLAVDHVNLKIKAKTIYGFLVRNGAKNSQCCGSPGAG